MNINWEDWKQHYVAACEYLNDMPAVLSAADYENTLNVLPYAYRYTINILGQTTDGGLNKDSLLGFVRVLPILRNYDFAVTAEEACNPQIDLSKYQGRYLAVHLFNGSGRCLTLWIEGTTILFKTRERTEKQIGYSTIKNPKSLGTLEIIDYADIGMIEKVLNLLQG